MTVDRKRGITMAKAGDNARKALVDELNGVLADHLALYIKTKSFHWHVAGPRFHDLHLLFDTQATAIFAVVDLIAERVRKAALRRQTIAANTATLPVFCSHPVRGRKRSRRPIHP